MHSRVSSPSYDLVADAEPYWTGIRFVRDLVGDRRVLLHAGPPYHSWRDVPPLVRNSLAFGCIFEGWTHDWESADLLLASGSVELRAAQDCRVVVPLAGVASPSMALIAVSHKNNAEASAYSVLNEGPICASRLGVRDSRLPAHHHWLNGALADWLSDQLLEPISLYPLLKSSLKQGDDGHAVTTEGSKAIAEVLLRRSRIKPAVEVSDFLSVSNTFALNVWMALSACILARAEQMQDTSIVSRAGGNGVEFGIQLASVRRWITVPASQPIGNLDPSQAKRTVACAVGDSAVVDFLGLGAQAIDRRSPVYAGLKRLLPDDLIERRDKILGTSLNRLDGRLGAVDAERVATLGRGPLVLLGMLDRAGEAGRIGAGFVDVPSNVFERALDEVDNVPR